MKHFRILFILLLPMLFGCQDRLPLNENNADYPPTQTDEVKVFISKADVLRIIEPITHQFPDRWVDVSNEIIPASTTVEYSTYGIPIEGKQPSAMKSPAFDSWLAVIGPDYTINGPQRLLHLFINATTGEFSEVWLDGRAILEWDASRYIYKENNENRSKLVKKAYPTERSSSPTQWAVILSGGINMTYNYARYWNDCQYVYTALTQQLNYPSDHIFCLIADGIDPANDRRTGPNSYDSSPVDFDNDGFIDINYSATKPNVSTVFSYLGSVVSPGDEILLFVTDHGEPGLIDLWNGATLSASELNAELNKLGTSVTVDVVMGQCYSGSFCPVISASNRTVVTAVNSSQTSNGSAINGYDYFLKYWTDAIYNINPSTTGVYSNGDGHLSLFELFKYAKSNPKAVTGTEEPQPLAPGILLWGHDLLGNLFVPCIQGPDNVSAYTQSTYTLNGLLSTLTPLWHCSSEMTIVSSSNSSASVSGSNMPASQYVSQTGNVTVSFMDLGESFHISKNNISVWKPGAYIGNQYVVGGNGSYFLYQCPSNGFYPGTSGYTWSSSNSAWTISYQYGATVSVFEGPTTDPVYLSVSFNDPFGYTIYVSDQVH